MRITYAVRQLSMGWSTERLRCIAVQRCATSWLAEHVSMLPYCTLTTVKLPCCGKIENKVAWWPDGVLPELRAAQAVAEGDVDDAVVRKVAESCRGTAMKNK